MKNSSSIQAQITIVCVPRDRFSYARESLESVYAHTVSPFNLVYVDGGSPRYLRRYLERQAHDKDFQLIRTDHYLSPNHARNIGLREVTTPYVIFIDNDVIVSPGWLEPLLACAQTTGAAIVAPLVCQEQPLHQIVHCAGGESGIHAEEDGTNRKRRLIEKIHHAGERVADLHLQRAQTGLVEFHCMLVRSNVFREVGVLDEGMMNFAEHVDFCMTVTTAGHSIWFEPASAVTFLSHRTNPKLTDILFYMLRWSDAWGQASVRRLRDKWSLTDVSYLQDRYRFLVWKRELLIRSLSRKLTLGHRSSRMDRLLIQLESKLNRRLFSRYERRTSQCARRESNVLYTAH